MLAGMFVTLTAAVLGCSVLAWLLVVVTLLVGHFFRDPDRITVAGEADVVSPADGKVVAIEKVQPPRFIRTPCLKISIFMSVFDVHVNRVPVSGVIEGVFYKKGGFLNAGCERASRENEQNWLWIKSDSRADILLTQVAGLIARRIVCWPTVGDRVEKAERFGMIRFGSRMDVYVPEDSDVAVSLGQHVYGGETVLCRLK